MKTQKLFGVILVIFTMLILSVSVNQATANPSFSRSSGSILYVKSNSNGDCLSWDTACDLQTAIGTASSGDQIWVGAGTYKPTTTTLRHATFYLDSGISFFGGFPEEGGNWESRDWELNSTILSFSLSAS